MLKRKLIKKWQKYIKKLTIDKIEKEIASNILYPPEKVDDLLILIDSYGNVKENEWRSLFREHLNEIEAYGELETMTPNSKVNPYLINKYKEFKEDYEVKEYEKAKSLYWKNILLNIERNTGITVSYSKEVDNMDIRNSILYCLENNLVTTINWDRWITFISALSGLAAAAVSIILALK